MKKIFILASLLISSASWAQSRTSSTEFGISVSTLNYSGEIATSTSTSALLKEVRPAGGLMVKRNFNDLFSMGLEASYGFIYASDANHSNPNRGLEVTTSLLQVNPFMELNLIRFGKFHYDQKFTIYLKAGGGFIAYNPDPKVMEVYPQGIDPEPNAYTGLNFFGGTGVRFRVGYKSVLSLEATIHGTNVDNMEGVFQESASNTANDYYGGLTLTFSKMVF